MSGKSSMSEFNTRRRWGYLIWSLGACVILVPECIAAFNPGWMPFTTISTMTAHLEREAYVLRLVVVALLVWLSYSTARGWTPAAAAAGTAAIDAPTTTPEGARRPVGPARTTGGRLSLRARSTQAETTGSARIARAGNNSLLRRMFIGNDDDSAPALFWIAVIGVLAIVAIATFVTVRAGHYGPKNPPYNVDYVLYGLIGLCWIVVPSLLAFGWGKDAPYPTLFKTVADLEEWLNGRNWRLDIGQDLAWMISYAILTGLVILLLHLIFYPFPNVTL